MLQKFSLQFQIYINSKNKIIPHQGKIDIIKMLQSPLRKNKHSYPLDFSIKKKQPIKKTSKKYDIALDLQNPQTNNFTSNASSQLSNHSSIKQIFLESNKKYTHDNNEVFKKNSPFLFQMNKYEDTNNFITQKQKHSQKQKQKITQKIENLYFENQNQKDFSSIQEPLRQVKRKNDRIIIDENKLKNPRIEINEEKYMNNNTEKTLSTISPSKQEKTNKTPEVGGIRHQDLGQLLQKYESEKQPPLNPQYPFDLLNKNTRRSSLLNKLKLNKIQQASQNHNKSSYQSYVNSQFTSGAKYFRPQTYTYANRLFDEQKQSSNTNTGDQYHVKRAKSEFQSHKKEKIIYINNNKLQNNQNSALTFNLPNLSFDTSINSTKKIQFQKLNNSAFDLQSLKSKFVSPQRQNVGKFFNSKNRTSFLSNNENNTQSNFQSNQINKLKAQINSITHNRLRNKSQLDPSKFSQTQRQFTFQDDQKNNSQMNNIKSNHQNKLTSSNPPVNKSKKPSKKLQITYHVPLVSLKSICKRYLSNPQEYRIAFKVPKVFMEHNLFKKSQSKEQLHQNALMLFESLKISSKNLIIKRYSNCLILAVGHIAVVWYYSGKRYLGGWQYEYLDEGSRHGLGLQWQPNNFVYYGEFRSNKKYGLGAIKLGPQQVTVGYWSNGKYIGTTFKQQNQQLDEQEQQQDEFQEHQQNQNYTGNDNLNHNHNDNHHEHEQQYDEFNLRNKIKMNKRSSFRRNGVNGVNDGQGQYDDGDEIREQEYKY